MSYNLNSNEYKRGNFDPIPPGIYRLKASIKPGGVGENELLCLAKNLHTQHVKFQHTVIGDSKGGWSEFDGRLLWDYVTVFVDLSSTGPDLLPVDPSQARKFQTSVKMGLTKLRRMLESAHEINPDDESEEAQQIREFDSVRVFEGLEFWGEVDIQPGINGYKDSNRVNRIVVPGDADWPTAEDASGPVKDPRGPVDDAGIDDGIPF